MEAENARLRAEVEALRARLRALEAAGASADAPRQQPDGSSCTAAAAAGAAAPAAAGARPSRAPPAGFVSPHGLTKPQAERYSRQLLLPAFGPAAQARLCAASALIVGCGGLGAPAALYLAAAGIGRLGLADHDAVEISNLHRQIIHSEARAGAHKAASAAAAVAALNSSVALDVHTEGLTPANAADLVRRYDLVIDASDNAPTRYLLSDAAAATGTPLVSAAAVGTDGQLTVYCLGEDGPCYRCLFPEPPAPGNCARCADAGVLGPVPGVMGVLQALEAVKILAGVGKPLSRQLLLFDALSGRFTTIKLRARAPDCAACGGGGGAAAAGDAAGGTGAQAEGPAGGACCSGRGSGSDARAPRGRMRPEDVAAFDYAAFTGQAAHDGAPPPLRVLPPDQRLAAAELRDRLAAAGLGGGDDRDGAANGASSSGSGGSGDSGGAAGCVLIDVRPTAQFGVMSLPGAVNLPFDSPERFRERHVASVLALASCGAGCAALAAGAAARDGGASGYGGAASATGSSGAAGAAPRGAAARAAAEQAAAEQQRPVYVVCRRGNHSQLAVQELRAAGLREVFDLAGGMEAWAAEVDPAMPVL
ncbi:adenylyltransferase and sulfurtransferase [Raphidocelis subcapitata]|uniref:Adenylyltransferase and sulfurtransferase MOCS3 n=1 Tax=Raphidocelis subcapitata TaxID=307507 RepID=A0A2V0NWI4_9CHLO|nr:adenylyltransferase and sulfurtransferase [Raphidocelis subcapitata]|eukprot:GBF89175.1 adenylyltransferase and sulfurtransferase [Raphidocelis subcapitata]